MRCMLRSGLQAHKHPLLPFIPIAHGVGGAFAGQFDFLTRKFFLPEQSASAINAKVGLHAFEAAHAIVQDLGRRVHCDALGEGPDLRPTPSFALCVFRNEEMVCEYLTKFETLQQVSSILRALRSEWEGMAADEQMSACMFNWWGCSCKVDDNRSTPPDQTSVLGKAQYSFGCLHDGRWYLQSTNT